MTDYCLLNYDFLIVYDFFSLRTSYIQKLAKFKLLHIKIMLNILSISITCWKEVMKDEAWIGICFWLLFVILLNCSFWMVLCFLTVYINLVYCYNWWRYQAYSSLGSSVRIMSDCGLDDQVQSPAAEKDFSSSVCIQTSSGAHPASYQVGMGGPFPGVKHGWAMMLTTHPHLVPRSRTRRSYSSFPLKCLHGI
jgi:hypothetical protein